MASLCIPLFPPVFLSQCSPTHPLLFWVLTIFMLFLPLPSYPAKQKPFNYYSQHVPRKLKYIFTGVQPVSNVTYIGFHT